VFNSEGVILVKSKYTPLVKLKKKDLDKAERDLIAANNALADASGRLNRAYQTLTELSLPTHGTFAQLTQAQIMIQAQYNTIEECKIYLQEAEREQLQMQNRFKNAMMEYEKFKHLELQEAQALVSQYKKEEAKMLDEIGIMTYKGGAI